MNQSLNVIRVLKAQMGSNRLIFPQPGGDFFRDVIFLAW